ncbi:MAG: response regulator transcription factor [Balneolaceae bacterium]
MNRLLLVEDDDSLGYILKEYLELNNFEVEWVKDGEKGIRKFQNRRFDLCILDVMLPKKDGFALAGEMRTLNKATPFNFLTAKTLKVDKLKGFNLGCDDYIVKPVEEELLIARIQAIIRRTAKNPSENSTGSTYEIGRYLFDYPNQKLVLDGHIQIVTSREAELLKMLCDHKNNLLERRKALEAIWGDPDYFNRRSMDVFVSKLRKYLRHDPDVRIENVHGRGFILKER